MPFAGAIQTSVYHGGDEQIGLKMRKMNRLAVFLAAVLTVQPLLLTTPAWAGNKKADKLQAQGREAEVRGDHDKALDFYERALALDPSDTGYLLSVRRARFTAAQSHVDRGQKLRKEGKLEEALAEFQRAFSIDPASSIAEQEMRRTYQMIDRQKQKKDAGEPEKPADRGLTPAEQARREAEKRVSSILPVPELKPISRQVTGLKMVNQTAKVLYETLGKLAGINVLFDSEYQDQKRFSIDLNNTTLDEALDNISLLTKTFYKPLSPSTIFVTQDNVTKRRDYEEQVTRIFYLQNLTSPQELQEVMTGMRTVTDVRKVFPINSQSAIVVRGTADQVALAEKVLLDLDKPKPEVIVDVLVMEANKTKTRDLAFTPVSGGKNGLGTSVTYTPGGGSGSGTGTGASTSTGLVPINSLSSMTTGDWSVTLPGFLLQALMSDRQTKVLTTPQVRATDGQKASLRLGDRYPYATGSFQPGVGAVGVSPLVSTQFQFAEVGVNVDLTPRIHANDEVSMQVEFEISNIREKVDVGGLSQPVIGQRKVNHIIRVKEGEVTLIGGLMQANVSKTKSGVPGLMNLPVIGRFFSSENLENTNSDLLVALVPHIVRTPEVTAENTRMIATGTETIYKLNYAPPKEEPAPAKGAAPAAPAAPGGLKTLPAGAPPTNPAAPAAPPPPPATTPASAPPPVQGDIAARPEAPGLARAGTGPATPALIFKPSATEVARNGTVTVDLQIDNVADLFSAPMRIKYDNKVLKLVEVQRGPFLAGDGQQVTFSDSKAEDIGAAIINMNRVAGAGGISGSGVLLTLKFQAIGQGVSPVRFEEVTLRDAKLETIAVTPPAVAVTVK